MDQQVRVPQRDPLLNDLLKGLPADELRQIVGAGSVTTLAYGEIVFDDDKPADAVYFPMTCMVSMLALMRNGDEIEYGSIGREGMLGLQAVLGAQPLRGRAMCQLEGEALRLDGSAFRAVESQPDAAPTLGRLLMRYAQSTINVLAQSAACNALHSTRERTARWLLMTRDRAGNDFFLLTQEFLAKMLGAARPRVSSIAADLRREGVIEYQRGFMRVLDAKRLNEASCECYELIKSEYARVVDLTDLQGRASDPKKPVPA